MAEFKKDLRRLLMMVKQESEEADLKLDIKKKTKTKTKTLRSWHPVPTLHGK